ncbi:MAG: hypothetical protein AAB036_07720 [Elusimicrobiota bacterium]
MNNDGPVDRVPKDIKDRPSRARYDKVKSMLDLKWRRRQPQSERLTRELADALWDTFGQSPWTWCGFWLLQPDGRAFQPGPARPEPASGPVGIQGEFASVLSTGEARPGQLTIVVPVLDKNARVWAVFEARSTIAFDDMDARWLERLFKTFQSLDKSGPVQL